MSIPRNLTEEEWEQVKEEMRREDAYETPEQEARRMAEEEEIEQATNERTLKDLHDHIVKALNTVNFLIENPDRQHKEFTQADVQAAWRDGYEAAHEEMTP